MKRYLLLLSYYCAFSFNDLLAQRHPFQDPQGSAERMQLFDGDWKFFLGDTVAASEIEGPGVIAGIDNGDLKDYDPYVGKTRKAWHGRALVVIKSTHGTGEIKLTVTSPGLLDATLKIKTK